MKVQKNEICCIIALELLSLILMVEIRVALYVLPGGKLIIFILQFFFFLLLHQRLFILNVVHLGMLFVAISAQQEERAKNLEIQQQGSLQACKLCLLWLFTFILNLKIHYF